MEKNLANELKKLDIEMGKKIFSIAKKNKITTAPSPLQARIIDFLVLHQKEEIYQKDLENHLEVSKATVSNALQAMENNGIIKRVTSKEDARSKKIILMEKSQRAYEDMQKIFKKLNEELTKGISDEELKMLFDLIERLRNNIQEPNGHN